MTPPFQLTLWGPNASNLRDYAYKLWSGMLETFYAPRWLSWFDGA
jgi:alpha-N-acetylglucosaminidase